MIHLTILLPLAISGIAGAIWREHHQKQVRLAAAASQPPDRATKLSLPPSASQQPVKSVFDDCVEIDHYQRISFYTLALSASAAWFYAPVVWLCIPLLSYNGYSLCKTVKNSSKKSQRSALTVFEFASLGGSLLTGRLVTGSVIFVLSFGMRKILLQAGNIAHIGLYEATRAQPAKVWVLQKGVEIESTLANLSADDIIVVRPGEPILIEGIVYQGRGIVRQFSLLNTFKSVAKQKGNKVFPFTRLESGRLLLRKY